LTKRLEEVSTLTHAEREIVRARLLQFTNKIVKRFPALSRQCRESASKLDNRRQAIISGLNERDANYRARLHAVEQLLRDCIRWGTIPFSIMARLAFMSCILLKSMAKEQKLDAGWVDSVLNSVRTPLSEFQEDYAALCERRLSEKEFFDRYGHLRPGTYDITALRYDKRKHLFDDIPISAPKAATGAAPFSAAAGLSLSRYSLQCSEDEFFDFVRNSLRQREELKFLFTKNLSDALELISSAGRELGFAPNDMAHLSVRTVLRSYKQLSEARLKSFWRKEIERDKEQQIVHSHLVLPPLIKCKDDFQVVTYFKAVPNFITGKAISEETVYLSGGEEAPNLAGKIILLDNADPGYDWIFTRNPAGLITKYGGVASHMSIRCAEIGLPAAIGCGEILFEKLLYAAKVLLDCANRQIITLEDKEPDPYMAERRALKYLGYIR
jgi:hypothetical protein